WEIGLDAFTESFPALGHGLEQMLTWTDGDVYDVFMREFEISYEYLGQVTTLPLKPGGQDIPVTNENREEYVRAYMDHYIHKHIQQEFEAFRKGFEKICGGEALKLLRPEELELLLCGNSDLDMHDLEASCLYDDGYSPNHTLIKEFWEIVHEDMSAEQHKQLLVFVTGSDRVPIRGLKDLMFVIQRNGPDSERLPTALTCFSRLLLPEYSSKEKMKERLVTAIENSNGFGLV
ncbi:putative E3 ubiquitin-protein ligase HTD2, partial [Mortierella sp. AD011]